MIELRDVYVTYAKGTPLENPIFQSLNLRLETGQFTTLIGSNGAGKSSLVQLITGDIQVERGVVLLDNCDVTKWQAYKRAPLISRVFQDPMMGSFSELTIEQNLCIAYLRGSNRTLKIAINRHLREHLRERLRELNMGLEDRMQDPMGLLSGGQRQAVNLVMATLCHSKILLLDEHTAALDPRMRAKVLELTDQLVKQYKLTTLMITHCMSQAFELGERTLVLHQGQLIHDLKLEQRQRFRAQDLVSLF